jgi:D-3-phosphoglycerate dehydrogenase
MICQGTYIYIRNSDTPGVVGKIGTLLGNNNINIAGFELSRLKGGDAISFISVDSEVPKSVLDQIQAISGIIEAKVVVL